MEKRELEVGRYYAVQYYSCLVKMRLIRIGWMTAQFVEDDNVVQTIAFNAIYPLEYLNKS